ncbi:hypothetical protein DRO35_04270 [Candidatus Bathyarchaeota archaeon]|nr:MAG: hypothetical protein DRO35_04270 [Candidatus Bathyarchaeota archaeon]
MFLFISPHRIFFKKIYDLFKMFEWSSLMKNNVLIYVSKLLIKVIYIKSINLKNKAVFTLKTLICAVLGRFY